MGGGICRGDCELGRPVAGAFPPAPRLFGAVAIIQGARCATTPATQQTHMPPAGGNFAGVRYYGCVSRNPAKGASHFIANNFLGGGRFGPIYTSGSTFALGWVVGGALSAGCLWRGIWAGASRFRLRLASTAPPAVSCAIVTFLRMVLAPGVSRLRRFRFYFFS